MSRYAKIMPNDVVDGEGICVSFWVQGCPFHCEDCHNPDTWDFKSGKVYTDNTKWEIIKLLSLNNIERNFSVLGGEPLAPQNVAMTLEVVKAVRSAYPSITIFLWTGYVYDELIRRGSDEIIEILNLIDILIDGPYIKERRNLNLRLRGSDNQHIWHKQNGMWEIEE